MSMLGSIAHTLGANGYLKTKEGDRYSFSNTSEGIYRFQGTILDPPGAGKPRQVYFTNPYSAVIAALATSPGSTGARIIGTRAGA